MTTFTEIPVLDLAPLYEDDTSARADLAAAFREAYSVAGFAYVINHGIPDALVERVFSASARFHALPQTKKMEVALNHNHRGFIPINTSTDVNSKLADVKKPNQSESFMVMREDGPAAEDVRAGAYLAGPNQWPDMPGFQTDVMTYHNALAGLGNRMMHLAIEALNADPMLVMPAFERATTWLRLLYYPTTDPMSDADVYGSAPHTDFGCLTILAQDDVGGLQVMTPSGAWIDAPYMPGAFVVNVGDMLHRWSNGILRSTPHRVINRSGKARYSCPFFYDPHVSTDIAPLAECVTLDRPARFDTLNFGAFLHAELGAGYDAHKTP